MIALPHIGNFSGYTLRHCGSNNKSVRTFCSDYFKREDYAAVAVIMLADYNDAIFKRTEKLNVLNYIKNLDVLLENEYEKQNIVYCLSSFLSLNYKEVYDVGFITNKDQSVCVKSDDINFLIDARRMIDSVSAGNIFKNIKFNCINLVPNDDLINRVFDMVASHYGAGNHYDDYSFAGLSNFLRASTYFGYKGEADNTIIKGYISNIGKLTVRTFDSFVSIFNLFEVFKMARAYPDEIVDALEQHSVNANKFRLDTCRRFSKLANNAFGNRKWGAGSLSTGITNHLKKYYSSELEELEGRITNDTST